MEQLTKFCMSIFALLAWTDYSSEFIIKIIKNSSIIAEYFKINAPPVAAHSNDRGEPAVSYK